MLNREYEKSKIVFKGIGNEEKKIDNVLRDKTKTILNKKNIAIEIDDFD